MYNVYKLWFLPYEDYYSARNEINKKANEEVNNYSMQSLSDAAYYDFYYGPNGKSSIKYNEDNIEKNALSWKIDSLDLFIEHFPYSKHFLPSLTRFVESKSDLAGIANVLIKYPKVPYDKVKMESKLLALCNTMYDVSLLKGIQGFEGFKQLESKAYGIAKASKSIPLYQQLVALYPNKQYKDEFQKLLAAESKRIEDDRLARLKAEGPGGVWYIQSVVTSLEGLNIVSKWRIIHLDKSESEIYSSLSSSISNLIFKGKTNSTGEEIDGHFIFKDGKYLYSNVRFAAIALYKIQHGIESYPTDGLIGVYSLKAIDNNAENIGYNISKENEKLINVNRNSGNNYGGTIHIIDNESVENVDRDNYNSMVINKDGKIIFQTNNPLSDNGIGAPNFMYYDLPIKVSIAYSNSPSKDVKLATIIITDPGSYDIRIR
jgi:hypothetical protein